MPNNWKTYKLGEVLSVKHGYAFKGKHFTTETNENLLLTPGNFKAKGGIKFNWGKQKFYNGKVPKEYVLNKGDLILALTDLTQACDILGSPAIIKNNKYNYLHNQRLGLVEFNESEVDRDFLFNFFNTKIFRNHLFATKTGSTVSHTAPERIYNGLLNLPPLPEQKAIAQILSAIDYKIENNLAINKTLEDMAMALYKHWFVDFDFPITKESHPELVEGSHQIGYKTASGEFIDSELGLIPKGWEVKRLDEVTYKNSKTFNFNGKEKVVFINTGDVQNGSFLHSNYKEVEGLPGQAKKVIEPNDILYSEIRPKNKRYAYVDFDSSDYVVSTKFMIIRNNEKINNRLLYRILTRQDSIDEFQLIAESRSGTFPQITFDAIGHFPIVLPNINLQNGFQELVEPLEQKQANNLKENQTLTKLRDTLLPKLINGDVRLKEFRTIFAIPSTREKQTYEKNRLCDPEHSGEANL